LKVNVIGFEFPYIKLGDINNLILDSVKYVRSQMPIVLKFISKIEEK